MYASKKLRISPYTPQLYHDGHESTWTTMLVRINCTYQDIMDREGEMLTAVRTLINARQDTLKWQFR